MIPCNSAAIGIKLSFSHTRDFAADGAPPGRADQSDYLPTLAIVDDDESDRKQMCRTFAKFGKFRCVGVYPGAEEAL